MCDLVQSVATLLFILPLLVIVITMLKIMQIAVAITIYINNITMNK